MPLPILSNFRGKKKQTSNFVDVKYQITKLYKWPWFALQVMNSGRGKEFWYYCLCSLIIAAREGMGLAAGIGVGFASRIRWCF